MLESKRVTLSDVAALAGVSSQTVSRVVNNHPYVSDITRQRVLEAIRHLNYYPNRAARSLATQRSCMLGIITYGMIHYGPAQMMSNVEQTAKAWGYSVSFTSVNSMTPEAIRDALETLGGREIDGLVLITPVLGVSYTDLTAICMGVPFVQVDTELAAQVPSVVIDQRHGAQHITQHLIDLGHKEIGMIRGPLHWHGARARFESWRDTLHAAGLEPGATVEGDWTAAGGYMAARKLLGTDARFTALFVSNDQMALGAMRALREAGLCIPEDVSVVGFDDTPEAAYFNPPLTTIQQNFAALGEQSVEYLIALIDKPDTPLHQRVLYPHLIVRGSTRAVE